MRSLEDIIANSQQETSRATSLSRQDLDIDSDGLVVQVKMKNLENKRYESDTKDRKWLAIWTAVVVSIWLSSVLILLVFNELKRICLSDTVLVALLGTTTLNVLGLSFIVLRGHFNSSR